MTKEMVRDGRLVVPTCPACGCRLEKQPDGDYYHFTPWHNWVGKDARGCTCPLVFETFYVNSGVVTPIWE